jgi:hypothetical protein
MRDAAKMNDVMMMSDLQTRSSSRTTVDAIGIGPPDMIKMIDGWTCVVYGTSYGTI